MGNAMAFNEQAYLAANPDVAAAIANGLMPSARFHYSNHGKAEMASGARTPMDNLFQNGNQAELDYAWANRGMGAPSEKINQLQNPGIEYDPAVYGAQDPRLTQAIGDAPVPEYASRYHEIRGIGTDFGALGMDVPDYSQTAVSTAAFKNPYHYVNSQTGELNRDQLQQEIQSGAFRFNPDYYAAQNPDLAAAGLTSGTDLMNHFLDYGWNEGRNYAIGNPNFTSDISNGAGGTVSGVNGSALPQFQDTLGGWNNTGTSSGAGGGGGGAKDPNAFDYEDFMSQITGMFGDMQSSWQNQFSDLQSQWQNQQNQYQQYTDQFFNNLWSTQPQAATYMSGNWNDPYQQSAVLPPQYQANNGGPQNGFAPNWQQSNPFSIPTF